MQKKTTGSFTLQANQKTQPIAVGRANWLYLFSATGPVFVELWKNRVIVESGNMELLTTLVERDFDSVVIQDITGNANTLEFWYGEGKIQTSANRANVTIASGATFDIGNQPTVDVASFPAALINGAGDALQVDMIAGNVTVNNATPNDIVPLADVLVSNVAIQLAAADANSLALRIHVPDDAPNGIRIGDSTVTAVKGYYLGPGDKDELPIKAHAVHAIRDGAADVNVTLTKLLNV